MYNFLLIYSEKKKKKAKFENNKTFLIRQLLKKLRVKNRKKSDFFNNLILFPKNPKFAWVGFMLSTKKFEKIKNQNFSNRLTWRGRSIQLILLIEGFSSTQETIFYSMYRIQQSIRY